MNERGLVEYLLGKLQEPERSHIEERLFTDEELEEELLASADDLIHAYLKGALSAEDRWRFEAHFLASSRHRERLAFIKDLDSAVAEVAVERGGKAVERPAETARSWQALWPVAAALTLLAAGVIFVLTRPSGNQRDAVTALASPSSAISSPAVLLAPTPSSALPQPAASKEPMTRVVRLPRESTAPVRVALSESTRFVQVEVAVPEGPPSFDAVLRAPDGTDTWRAESLPPPASGKRLVFTVPAKVLRADAYTLRVEGEPLRDAAPPVLEYRVRVVRER